ncbi:MAG: SdiA-regulated domain-containing protein [Lewinellaceae bacterium]|nr:SdiA-regulated domain-containing protein [Lewinellaceae bacterium]
MNLLLPLYLLLSPAPPDTLPYDLRNPSHIINLVSEDLQEISGLSPTDVPGKYLAIADEKGEVFFVDGNGGAITRRILFRDKGDFEGVEMVGQCLYAVKSNGDLFEIGDWKQKKMCINMYDTHLDKEDDVEGLGYDLKRNCLLLVGKGNADSSYIRDVYAFDLTTKLLGEQPVYSVNPLEVNRLLPPGSDENNHFFSPSSIAIHPITGDVYITSTAQKRLLVLDYDSGAIKYVTRLDKKMLPQPEGIAFDSNGDMLLSSEGKKGEGLVFRFLYRGKVNE